MKIIGLSGTNGSGKDTVAEIIEKNYEFFVVSANKMLGDELVKRGQTADRVNKSALSAEWRREFGLDVIVNKAIEQAKSVGATKLIVGSLRNPGEAQRVKELNGKMIWVDADPKIRYERIQAGNRGRVEDNKTFAEFQADEEREMNHEGDKATLSSAEVKKLCDIFIENNGDYDGLLKDVNNKLEKYIN